MGRSAGRRVVRGPWLEHGASEAPVPGEAEILARAAHDERDLQVLMGRVELFQQLDVPPRVTRVAEQILADADRLSRLARDYLLYGQLQRRPLFVDAQPVPLLPLLVRLAERTRVARSRSCAAPPGRAG